MIHQCRCGFATNDREWLESHQEQYEHGSERPHDVSGLTASELERARRELEASLALARPGSMISVPIMAQIRAIGAALSGLNGPTDMTALPSSPFALSPWRG
jgi:hypothetical protein